MVGSGLINCGRPIFTYIQITCAVQNLNRAAESSVQVNFGDTASWQCNLHFKNGVSGVHRGSFTSGTCGAAGDGLTSPANCIRVSVTPWRFNRGAIEVLPQPFRVLCSTEAYLLLLPPPLLRSHMCSALDPMRRRRSGLCDELRRGCCQPRRRRDMDLCAGLQEREWKQCDPPGVLHSHLRRQRQHHDC